MKRPRQPGMKARSVLALALAVGFLAQVSNVLAQDAPPAKPAEKTDAPKADKQNAPAPKSTNIARQPVAPGENPTPPAAGDVKKLTPSKKGKAAAQEQKVAPAKRGIPEPTVVLKPGEVPKIKFDTPVYDFGRVAAGTSVEHEYWFTNVGTGPLEILKVKPG